MRDNIPQEIDQYGFTLIELMISLVLGLLISAAVMQVFLTSQRVDRIQTAGSEIQDKAVFGLQGIESQVRLANLGNDGIAINDTTAMGGIVLTAGDYISGEGSGDGDENDEDDKGEDDKDDDDKDDDDKDDDDKDDDDKDDDDKDDEKKKKKLEKEAKKLDKDADKLEKEASGKEEKAQKEEKKGKTEEAEELRKEAEEKRKEAEEKRKEAEEKRKEAAQIGNKNAYSYRSMPTPEFQRANFQVFDFQQPVFQRANVKRQYFQRANFQKVAASSSSGFFNVMVKEGLDTGYLTRSNSMGSNGSSNKWGGLSNTGTPSDQLTIQYVNTTGRPLFDCEGEEVAVNERVITRYFVTDGGGAGNSTRRNLNLNCDAGRIKSDGTLENFTDSGETIIENIDQFNIRLGVQRTMVDNGTLSYQYADMTVAEYMALGSGKPAITNISMAILARSTANSPEASADEFMMLGTEQKLKQQDDAPKYLRRVYESNVVLRNARVMRIIDTSIV